MVEDEYEITEFISKSLVKYGYNIKIASNLEEARLILKNEGDSINLIFIDVVLPDGDGRILGEEVSKLYPNIKIILNNSVYSKNEIKARDMEFDFDFIQEPYKIENIMGEIEDYINGNFKV
jgi:two-component system response regulator HydG